MWYDVIVDALLDTLKLLPFLLLLYILIELMEHNTKVGKPTRALSGKWGPVVGTATGLVPMCGFSVMAAKLWEHRHVTLGALLAVFIATSDEGLLVLLLSEMPWAEKAFSLLALVGSKLVLGIGVGYLADLLAGRKKGTAPLPEPHEHVHEHEHDREHDHVHEHEHDEHDHEENHEEGDCACGELTVCEHKKESTLRLYLLSPLLHALQVAAFVLLVNLAFGFLVYFVGKDNVELFLNGAGYWYQPVICSLIGLIPNCASSVVLAEAYAVSGIGFGALLGGLVVNAGLGYLVLFRRRTNVKTALLIVGFMLVLGMAVGYAAGAIELVIP